VSHCSLGLWCLLNCVVMLVVWNIMLLETSNKSHRQPFGTSHDCSWAYTKEYDKISSYVLCMCHVHTAQVSRVDILDLAKPMNCHKWWPSHACQHGILSSDSPVECHFPGTCFHLLDPFQLVKERNYTNSKTFTLIWTMKIKGQQMTKDKHDKNIIFIG
jgi:hypothetical protein